MPEITTLPKGSILLVEDDPVIAEFVATELRLEGYAVLIEPDGVRGLLAARQNSPDLVILDRMLPGMDGGEICHRLRQTSDVPIIMLTALGSLHDRVEGLNLGANDYLAKPFALEELIARINAQLRARAPRAKTMLAFADLSVDLDTHEASRGNRPLSLTPTEFELLRYLLEHARQVKTREQIVQAVWGYDFVGETNVVDVYIRYLRTKIEQPGQPRLIHTVRGIGYILKEEFDS